MSLQQHTKSHYAYRLTTDGCDECWDVYDTLTGETIASFPFWDLASESCDLAEAQAQRLLCLLGNSQRGR